MNGHFFVFDGMDGAGKSTALSLVAGKLRAQGLDVVTTREPGGSPLAENIRECMLGDWPDGMPLQTELLLVFAARAAHLQQTVLPALQRGQIVLCDRFVDSSHVYQGVLGGISAQWIDTLSTQTITRMPDATFIFDLPVEQAVQRLSQRGLENRFDRADQQRMQTIRDAFRQRVSGHKNTHHLVDASQDQEQVLGDVLSHIRSLTA